MQLSKPTTKEIEDYLNNGGFGGKCEKDYYAGFNGTTKEDLYNSVSKPKHYMLMPDIGVEVRDVIQALSAKIPNGEGMTVPLKWDTTLFVSDYVQLMQYLMRFMDKNGKEDLEKARWYLDKMIESY